jgi:putative FmdB family regulatory protein
MPVYEYRCDACEKLTEAIQKFSDAPLVDCELCGAKGTLKKQMSRTSFALKGSGWYTTDYKRSGPNAAAPSSTATGATETKPAEAKPSDSKSSDSKPSGGGEST